MSHDRRHKLINILSDGRFHSGEELGQQLGVSRAAIWKSMESVKQRGLEVHAITGKGYRLAASFDPLERNAVLAGLDETTSPLLKELEILSEVDSTNGYLLKAALENAPSGSACIAEYQSSGRGRRGRQWISPYGSNIALSLLWRFNDGTGRLGGLSLAIAVALMHCLEELGLGTAGIKWPNDILVDSRKLAGILLDVAGESNGPCHVVIGVGINYRLPEQAREQIDQPWTDLQQCGINVNRNHVAGRLLHHIIQVISRYQDEGIVTFRDEWSQWDLTCDKEVTIHQGDLRIPGVARGIDENGLLLVEQDDGLRRYASGEVSLRSRAQ